MAAKISLLIILLTALHAANTTASERYYVQAGTDPNRARYFSAYAACEAWRTHIQSSQDAVNPGGVAVIKTAPLEDVYPNLKNVTACVVRWTRGSSVLDYGMGILAGGCLAGRSHKAGILWPAETSGCEGDTYVATVPKASPPPQQCAGNPININNGSKYQHEFDIYSKGQGQVSFHRFYNKPDVISDAQWQHNFDVRIVVVDSTLPSLLQYKSGIYTQRATACVSGWDQLKAQISESWTVGTVAAFTGGVCQIIRNDIVIKSLPIVQSKAIGVFMLPGSVQLRRPIGSSIEYQNTIDGNYVALNGDQGILRRINSGSMMWRYISKNGEQEEFAADGKLMSITANNGIKQQLFYDSTTGLLSRVKDTIGREIQFTYTNGRLSGVTVDGNKTTTYSYNTMGLINDVRRPDNTQRLYHYEDPRFPAALTGITDERGVRYATWSYDAQGRAISSEHAGGAEKTLLAFNADGSTTVTNSLNKQTIYRFNDITGARRVIKVEGQPTTNCAGANQDYTYTPEGWIASKTDWKGIRTIFSYNTLGQEVSRTEAFATPEARTITTEWHPTLYLKTKVTEPQKETIYSYDANGRLLNETVHSLSGQ